MGREVLGVVACPVCGNPAAEVRRMEPRKPRGTDAQAAAGRQGGKVGALYLTCRVDGAARCGVVQGSGPEFQARLSRLIGGEPPRPAAPAAKAEAAKPEPDAPAPAPRPESPRPAPRAPAPAAESRRSFFGFGGRS